MSQLKTKFIEDNAVTAPKVRLGNAAYLRGRNAANSADVNIVRVNGSDVLEFPTVPQILSGTPSAANDVATIQAVKDIAAGLRDPKDAVRAASTTNIALPPGGTTLTVDSVVLSNSDRLLLAGQTTASQNGIYVVSGVGSAVVLTRATDMDANTEVTYGLSTLVVEGTVNASATFMLTTADPITLGSTALTLSKIAVGQTYTGGDGIALAGTTFSADLLALGGLTSSNPGNIAGQIKVQVSTAAAVKDRTTTINASGDVESLKHKKENFTLGAGDITNQYVDLLNVAAMDSVRLFVAGSPEQIEGVDFSLSYTGGASSKTRVTFLGDLATGGTAALVAADVARVVYEYL